MELQIFSFNVNGFRAAWRKGLGSWLDSLAAQQPQVFCFQEVRASGQQVSELLGEGWQVHVYECAVKGRAGVALAVRADAGLCLENLQMGLPEGLYKGEENAPADGPENGPDNGPVPAVDTGRWLEATLTGPALAGFDGGAVRVASAYLHAGAVDTPRQEQKMAYLQRVDQYLHQLSQGPTPAVVCGDFNIVRTQQDIKNWKSNHNKSSGVLDEEIAYLDAWMGAEGNWADVQRLLAPEGDGPYTWWSQRGKAFDNNAGWRIDYHMATPALAQRATDFVIHRAPSYDTRVSDHAALQVNYHL